MTWELAAQIGSALGGLGTLIGVCVAPEVWRRQQQRQAEAQAAVDCRFHAHLLLTLLGERSVYLISEHDYDHLSPMEMRLKKAGEIARKALAELRDLGHEVDQARRAYVRGLLYLRGNPDLAVFLEILSLQREALVWMSDYDSCIAFMERRLTTQRTHGAVFAAEPRFQAALENLNRRSVDLFGEVARFEHGIEKLSRALARERE